MKRILSVTLMTVILCLSFTVNAFSSRMTDNDGLLTYDEEISISEKLDEISESTDIDVAALTVSTLEGKSPMVFADDYYDQNGYGRGKSGGVLLVICLSSRDWYITTAGDAIRIISDSYIDRIGSNITGYLADGEYYKAIDKYADMCQSRIEEKQYGSQYDSQYGNRYGGGYADKLRAAPWFWIVCIALVIGFIAAIITVSVMKSKLKSVRYQSAAGDYIREGSFNLTEKSDHYLYCTVTRTARPKDNDNSSSHTSSSGASHGGGGGKF